MRQMATLASSMWMLIGHTLYRTFYCFDKDSDCTTVVNVFRNDFHELDPKKNHAVDVEQRNYSLHGCSTLAVAVKLQRRVRF